MRNAGVVVIFIVGTFVVSVRSWVIMSGVEKAARKSTKRDDPLVKWSKKLSCALRHKALEWGIPMESDGFVKVSDLCSHKDFRGLSFDVLQSIVQDNDKKRFELVPLEGEIEPVAWKIRAVQGGIDNLLISWLDLILIS